jgi:hypothetical protein
LGLLIERRNYKRQEWFAAACITSGVVLFHTSRSQTSNSGKNSLYGIIVLLVSSDAQVNPEGPYQCEYTPLRLRSTSIYPIKGHL